MKDTNCCLCGVRIYFDDDFYNTLRDTHKTFYCLNGHGQSFVGKSEAEKQKEICNIIKQESNKRIDELKQEISSLRDKSIHCSICGEFFKSTYALNRHIKNKHKKPKKPTFQKKRDIIHA